MLPWSRLACEVRVNNTTGDLLGIPLLPHPSLLTPSSPRHRAALHPPLLVHRAPPPFSALPALSAWAKSAGEGAFKCFAGSGPELVEFTAVLDQVLNSKCCRSPLQLNVKMSISALSKKPLPCSTLRRQTQKGAGYNPDDFDQNLKPGSQRLSAAFTWLWLVAVTLHCKHPLNFITK